MKNNRESIHGEWSSRWMFVLAATGAAVGLGNIWKFPYITGVHGGGAFVLVYLFCILTIGIPLLMAEIAIGRRGRRNPATTMQLLAEESGHSSQWKWVGLLGILSGFLILSYYSVIAGWALDYVFQSAWGEFHLSSPETIAKAFTDLTSDPEELVLWHTLIMLITTGIVARGVQNGLEKSVLVMLPALFILLTILLVYAMETGSFKQGFQFIFHPNFSQLSGHGWLAAMGHAFFTLSLACGSIIMYGAYLPKNASITLAAVAVAGADTLVSLMASLIIFPIVFANGLEPSAGPGLIFQTLPIAFGHMPHGSFFGTLFFIMLVFAAVTSTISLIEPSIAWLMEVKGFGRVKSTIYSGVAIWALGLCTVFSFNLWQNFHILSVSFFQALDYLTANIMLPIGGLLTAVFTGWVIKTASIKDEITHKKVSPLFSAWINCLRYITPTGILIVIASFLGLIN